MLEQPNFRNGAVDTHFIDEHPELFHFKHSQNRAQKILRYLGELQVNGPLTPLVTDLKPQNVTPVVPHVPSGELNSIIVIVPNVQTGSRPVVCATSWCRRARRRSPRRCANAKAAC